MGTIHFDKIVNIEYVKEGFDEYYRKTWDPASAIPVEWTIPVGAIQYNIECIAQFFILKGGYKWDDTLECDVRVRVPFIGINMNFDYKVLFTIAKENN